jgi:hypothetical protein
MPQPDTDLSLIFARTKRYVVTPPYSTSASPLCTALPSLCLNPAGRSIALWQDMVAAYKLLDSSRIYSRRLYSNDTAYNSLQG